MTFEMREDDRRDTARWVRRAAVHGFVDFNHVFRPTSGGVAKTHDGVAIARCVLRVPENTTARLRIAWDDNLVLRINGDQRLDMGFHGAFRAQKVDVRLRAGDNVVVRKLSNVASLLTPRSNDEQSSNHGGWAFAFRATAADGSAMIPRLL